MQFVGVQVTSESQKSWVGAWERSY